MGLGTAARLRENRYRRVSKFTIGVDVGGTKVAAALVDGSGRLVQQSRTETETDSYSSLLDGIVLAARQELEDAGNAAQSGSPLPATWLLTVLASCSPLTCHLPGRR